jgi:hypothetical protein
VARIGENPAIMLEPIAAYDGAASGGN